MKFIKQKLVPFLHEKAVDAAQLSAKAHAAIITTAVLVATSPSAMAAGGGFAGFFSGWTSAFEAGLKFVFLAGVFIGVCFCLYGLINLAKKGGERGDDIKWTQVLWPIIGGACASVLLYIMSTTVETGGGSAGDIGKTL